jgi:hypothetical protein
VRVRVGRAYLLQAFYLAFLILIVALAYQAAIGDNPDLRNPVRVQEALVGFYRIVMSMLVALIALIAPALTANAITLERERKTMDLLLATPLTARQLLVGKLLGSFAFIVLLLALTLPVSAVSVLLGGVSFPELLKAYLLIACGGLVLCAIALFSSVYARNSTLAVLWSYLRVAGFLLATGVLIALQEALAFGAFGGRGAGALNLAFPQALLNPVRCAVRGGHASGFRTLASACVDSGRGDMPAIHAPDAHRRRTEGGTVRQRCAALRATPAIVAIPAEHVAVRAAVAGAGRRWRGGVCDPGDCAIVCRAVFGVGGMDCAVRAGWRRAVP